jgi:hypothetical protein
MIQVCTVNLDILIKNYLVNSVDKSTALKHNVEAFLSWHDEFLTNTKNLLSLKETNIIGTLRKEFANGNARSFLNKDDYEQIMKTFNEGKDYCLRVVDNNETLCILSKKEIK